MMNAVNMLVKETPEPAVSAKGRKDGASATGKGDFSRELDGVNGRGGQQNAVAREAGDKTVTQTADAQVADEPPESEVSGGVTTAETVARKLAARSLRLTQAAAATATDAQTTSETLADADAAALRAADAKANRRSNTASVQKMEGFADADADATGTANNTQSTSKAAGHQGMVKTAATVDAATSLAAQDTATNDPVAQTEQLTTGCDASLGDVLGILATSGALQQKGRDGTDWRDTRDTSRIGNVDGAAGAKAAKGLSDDTQSLSQDTDASEATPEGGEDRIFRLQRGEGRGQSVDLAISSDDEGRVDVDARLTGQGKAETVNVLESRRYLGFDTPSNASTLTSALVGDGDWATAMQPTSRLANEAQVSSTGQVVNTLKLQMTPESLGTVTAMLRLSGEELSVHLTVNNAAAYRELKDDASAMVDALRAQGFSVDQVTVGMASSSSQTQTGSDGNGQAAQQNAQQMAGEGQRNGERGNRQETQRAFSVDDATMAGDSDGVDTADAAARTSGGARPGHMYL